MTEVMTRKAFRQLHAKKPKRSKYRAQPVIIDGISFASKREGERWCELRLMERTGEITGLKRQVRFPLSVNGIKVTTYVSDFTYRDPGGRLVVEDAKGIETAMFRLKRKWMSIEHGIDVRTV
jgi:Protein of unknown function (DUF1064)